MPVIYKLIEKVLIERETLWLHDASVISPIQSAGQPQCSSLHTSFLSQEAIAHYINKNATVYKLFLDAQKAFDTVWVKGLLYKLHMKGINMKTWRLIQNGYNNFECAVFIGNVTGEWFYIERGVHQGSPFSMWLYMIFVNDLIEELGSSGYGISINETRITSPGHADDIAIMAIYKKCMNILLERALDYTRKWQYMYNESKTYFMVFGPDKEPHVVIQMGGVPIQVVSSYKHVGVTLCTNSISMKQAVSKRINTAQGKLLAARGIGSHTVPTPVSVMNKIYWSVVIPSLIYGYDVQPLEECDVIKLENAHRKNAKIVMNVSQQVATPAPLAPLGWLSMKALLLMSRILFMMRLLCMNTDNVYKQILLFRLDYIIINGYTRRAHRSPVDCMYEAAEYFGLLDKLIPCVQMRDFGGILEWKKIVKQKVWAQEHVMWEATCFLYDSLNVYRNAITGIKLHTWWIVANYCPSLTKKVASLMSVLMGSQPVGKLCNFKSKLCRLCKARKIESPLHVLYGCTELGIVRYRLHVTVMNAMPNTMREHYSNMIVEQKMSFLLSAMNVEFTSEWINTYRCISMSVNEMYTVMYVN